ncbi:hypothetical protein [Vibrio gazogenes]|nr:hypothetical protein [Vibrio gazogenes]
MEISAELAFYMSCEENTGVSIPTLDFASAFTGYQFLDRQKY